MEFCKKLCVYIILLTLLIPQEGSALAPWHSNPQSQGLAAKEDPSGKKPLDPLFFTKVNPLLDEMELEEVHFWDGGPTRSNFSYQAEWIMLGTGSLKLEDPGVPLPQLTSLDVAQVPEVESLDFLLIEYEFHQIMGRTLIYKHKDKESYRAIKVMKSLERPGLLKYESEWMGLLFVNKAKWDLKGLYPKRLIDGDGVVRTKKLPVAALTHLEKEMKRSEGEWAINRVKEFPGGDQYVLTAYEVLNEDYFRYVNQADVSEADFRKAIELSLHDFMSLARRGIIHTALSGLAHTQDRSRSDEGKYLWMNDIIHDVEFQNGAGVLANWLKGLRYPNLRLSGLADFAEMASLEDLIKKGFSKGTHLEHNLNRFLPERRKQFTLMSFLGDLFLTVTLLVGERFREKDEWDWDSDESLVEIHQMMESFFVEGALQFGQKKERAQLLAQKIDWQQFVRQMALFLSKGEPYAPFLLKGSDNPSKGFPQKLFGEEVTLTYSDDYFNSRGFLQTEIRTGYFREAFFPETIRSFFQREPHRVELYLDFWNMIRKVRMGDSPTAIYYSDDNQTFWSFLTALKEESPRIYREFLEELRPDLGPVNGPNPLQELIKALYLFTATMVWEKSDQQFNLQQEPNIMDQAINTSI